MNKRITQTLVVVEDWPESYTVDEVDLAVEDIERGMTAYVDNDDAARAVLRALGLSDEDIEDRLLFASTGRISTTS